MNAGACKSGIDDSNKKGSTRGARSLDGWQVGLAPGTSMPGGGGTCAHGSRLKLALPHDLLGGIAFPLLRRMEMLRNHALPLHIASFGLGE